MPRSGDARLELDEEAVRVRWRNEEEGKKKEAISPVVVLCAAVMVSVRSGKS